jgi:hypothetical protein
MLESNSALSRKLGSRDKIVLSDHIAIGVLLGSARLPRFIRGTIATRERAVDTLHEWRPGNVSTLALQNLECIR